MPTPRESRAALQRVTAASVAAAAQVAADANGSAVEVRATLLEAVPAVLAYYTDGSSALAADFYDDERERAGARGRFIAEPVIIDRAEKIRRAIAWATEPLFSDVGQTVGERLAPVVQLETARPYRDTITENRRRDPEAVGWARVTAGGCKFCRMLASRGAVYKEATARFASHPNCHCTAQPVFRGEQIGPEADVLQYEASKRRMSDAARKRLRDYLASMPD